MYAFAKAKVQAVEQSSASVLKTMLPGLRELSPHDFCELLFSMPNHEFPRLSVVLPKMASSQVQVEWTGVSGDKLLDQTTAFVRILETAFVHHTGRELQNSNILDFGCGYGRFVRAMLYYTDPENIFGVDAWQKSLDTCKDAKLPGNFALSDSVPLSLPVGDTKFDLAFAFSIFTHLSERSARASLNAIRQVIKSDGLLVVTARPVEFWAYRDRLRNTKTSAEMVEQHNKAGFAFDQQRPEYGDASMPLDFFETDGWKVVGYETISNGFQIATILRPI